MCTIRHMIADGTDLRAFRESISLSQARLAELTKIPQYILSNFELKKAELNMEQLQKVNDIFSNIESHKATISRKKRYKTHSYNSELYERSRATLIKKYSYPGKPSLFIGVKKIESKSNACIFWSKSICWLWRF